MALRLHLAWCLPRQPATVTIARHLLDAALTLLGATAVCRADIALLLAEACANAVRHAHGDEYQVNIDVHHDRCEIEVIDSGPGLNHQRLNGTSTNDDLLGDAAVHGRGLLFIRACSDAVELHPVHPRGLAIRMRKDLAWDADAPGLSPERWLAAITD